MNIRRLVLAGAAILTIGSISPAEGSAPTGNQPAGTAQPAPAQPAVYDEQADARQQIAAALAKAKDENRRVLIQWGGNWCHWCILLNNLCTTNKDLKHELLYEYDVVHVDIGHSDRNMDLAAKYGAQFETQGVPYLTVLDADGNVLANQETGALETGDKANPGHDPAKVLKFLTDHQGPPLSAETVLNGALVRAKSEGKKVFLHFGAPWCGWCHRLEDWMAMQDVADTLERSFVLVKIDQDRMTGASDVFDRYKPAGSEGIPWMAFLDAEGRAIVTSDGPKGNIGFPAADEEIAWFVEMLDRAGVPSKDSAALAASLKTKQ